MEKNPNSLSMIGEIGIFCILKIGFISSSQEKQLHVLLNLNQNYFILKKFLS